MKNKKLTGHISINRTNGAPADETIKISLVDSISGCQCCEILMDLETFAATLMGLAHQPCKFEWRPTNVGKLRETKTEIVFVPDYGEYAKRKENAKKALAAHEVDGWVGSTDDATNHYCWDNSKPERKGGRYFRVGFKRWVDAPEEKE